MTAIRSGVVLLLLAIVSSCSTGEPARPSGAPPSVGANTNDVGGGPDLPRYRDPPKRLRSGEYRPPLDTIAERQRGGQARAAEAARPKFRGWINGIYIGTNADPSFVPIRPCPRSEVRFMGEPEDEAELRTSPNWFEPPSYLPPGTDEWTFPSGAACGDQPAYSIGRQFLIPGGPDLQVSRGFGRFLPADVSRDRISATTIGGLPGVIIYPLMPDGFGDSFIVVREGGEIVIKLSAIDLPIAELQRIAEALVADVTD